MMLVGIFRAMPQASSDDKTTFVLFVLGAMAMLVPDMVAIGWVGMWKGMAHNRPRRAAGATVSQILILPWVVMALVLPFQMFQSFKDGLAFWFIVGVITDVSSIFVARDRLRSQFRARAAVHGEEALGLLGRLGRRLGGLARAKAGMT